MLQLTIHTADAVNDPYVLEHADALLEAITAEAEIVASDAGSDLLESPAQHHRDVLRDQIIAAASRELRAAGDAYRDPVGVRWTLEDVDQ